MPHSYTSHPGQLPDAILIVEDEPRSQRLLRMNLDPAGYRVVISGTAAGVLELIDTHEPALVVLDLKLPDGDGFLLCQQIRAISTVPIIVVSAFTSSDEKVRAFQLGADDYITKPYDPAEVVARIDAIFRRTRGQPPRISTTFAVDGLVVDVDQHAVTLNGVAVMLTPTEYRLLEYLVRNAGRTLVTDTILAQVWGDEYRSDNAAVHLYISRLRRKLGDNAQQPRFIHTRPGIGYMFAAEMTSKQFLDRAV